MRERMLFVCLVLMAAASSGCFAHVIVAPELPNRDSVSQPALQAFMKSVESPSIVLRVPSPQRLVTEAQAQQGNAAMNLGYNLIERELVKAGFTVRDRGLLEEVLRSNQNLDYRVIQQKINAQMILEIASISSNSYANDAYSRVKDGRSNRLSGGTFPIDGWQFECKVILVNTGEIGGIYTIHIAPQENHFLVSGDDFTNATDAGQMDSAHRGYGVEFDAAIQLFVQELIFELKPSTRTPLRVPGTARRPAPPQPDAPAGAVAPRRRS